MGFFELKQKRRTVPIVSCNILLGEKILAVPKSMIFKRELLESDSKRIFSGLMSLIKVLRLWTEIKKKTKKLKKPMNDVVFMTIINSRQNLFDSDSSSFFRKSFFFYYLIE